MQKIPQESDRPIRYSTSIVVEGNWMMSVTGA